MRYIKYFVIGLLVLAGCEKFEPGVQTQSDGIAKRSLDQTEQVLKANLEQTARIVAGLVDEPLIMDELTLISEEGRSMYSLSFNDLIDNPKGIGDSFRNLRSRFLDECEKQGDTKGYGDLVNYLMKNDCYLYVPYPASFYPRGVKNFTVAAHPVDNDIENTGYVWEGGRIKEVRVNEEYADKNPVLLIMPKDEKEEGSMAFELPKDLTGAKAEPVYEVRIGKVRCADYCGGLFEGTLELRIARGFPTADVTTGEVKGAFTVLIPIDYPRDYAKAAINNWTVHAEGGWLNANIIWDSNWQPSKVQQCILVYEYDQVKEATVSATVGYKANDFSPTITVSAKTTYRGDFLGISEWDRNWFYATNTNPGPYDEVKDGWTVRKTSPVFKLTTPARTLYY
ncbi:MAG: hypothetical protein HPY62_03460 [Bacteroidales bacterium]|nr:hypothetical protein [Bacteroidales bacterium]